MSLSDSGAIVVNEFGRAMALVKSRDGRTAAPGRAGLIDVFPRVVGASDQGA